MKPPLKALILGSLCGVLLCVSLFLFINKPQCPSEYTQAQVDASDCVVGANIGLGLFVFAASVILVSAVAGATVLIMRLQKKKPQ